MKTRITKAQLAEANGAVKGLVAKDGLSNFSRIRLDVVGPNVSLTGSNGDMQIEYRVEGETIADGTLALPGGLLGRFVDAMPTGAVEIDGEAGKKVKISGGEGVTFRLAAADAMDYPVMAGPKAGCAAFDIESLILKEMLRKVKFAASADGSGRAHLCGVNVKMKDWKLEMTATDGRQLAHVEKDLQENYTGPKATVTGTETRAPEFNIILANKTVNELSGLLDDNGEETVTIQVDARASATARRGCRFQRNRRKAASPGGRRRNRARFQRSPGVVAVFLAVAGEISGGAALPSGGLVDLMAMKGFNVHCLGSGACVCPAGMDGNETEAR